MINTTYQLAPWADLLYACDVKWWAHYRPQFDGLQVTQDARVDQPGVHRVPSEDAQGLSLNPLRIHTGSNGGYQALNLAVLLGASKIVLLGYDMRAVGGKTHWHADHPNGMNNPYESLMALWVKQFQTTLGDLAKAGCEVVNATPGSALDCFPVRRLDDALRCSR